ncbi:MAG: hypothetical protein STSR0002_23330 [Smithella sp.]
MPTVRFLFSDQDEIEPLRFFVDEVTILLLVFFCSFCGQIFLIKLGSNAPMADPKIAASTVDMMRTFVNLDCLALISRVSAACFSNISKFRLPDVGRVFAGNFGNGDGTFFCKNGKDMAG